MGLATVITPNVHELAALLRGDIAHLAELDQVRAIVVGLYKKYNVPLVVKGVMEGSEKIDILFDGLETKEFRGLSLTNVHTHGTGCTFSAALTAYLAHGYTLEEACQKAKDYVTKNLREGVMIGRHGRILNHA